ncbi:MAG TPA: hypothetical protein VF888_03685, partial [Nitrospirota bacterium]
GIVSLQVQIQPAVVFVCRGSSQRGHRSMVYPRFMPGYSEKQPAGYDADHRKIPADISDILFP